MQDISASQELIVQLLREWQLPDELIEVTKLLGNQNHSSSSQTQKLESEVKQFLDSFSYTHQTSLLISEKFNIDAALIALAYHYTKLQQMTLQVRTDYKALVHLTRENVFPLVKKLGMWDFKRALEDALFCLAAQDQYKELNNWFNGFKCSHHESWNSVLEIIQSHSERVVKDCKIKVVYCGVEGARRRLVRLGGYEHAKIQNYARIYIVVPCLIDCYSVLAAVHSVGLPEPYSFQDMIAIPHSNGYSGLLTSICFNAEDASREHPRQVFDVLILTHLMEQVAHRGVTYPLCYRAIRNNARAVDTEREERCIKSLVQSILGNQNDKESIITVFTAKGETKDLKAGSTVLDLAYKLHTAIGDRAVSAEINDKWVPLSTRLKNGDRVRIHGSEQQGVRSEADLQNVYDRTTRRALLSFLNKEPARKGRHLIATYLRNQNEKIEDGDLDSEVNAVCQKIGMTNLNELYCAIAEKKIVFGLPGQPRATAGLVGALIIQRRKATIPEVPILTSVSPTNDWVPSLDEVNYSDALPFRLCGICRPNPLNQIVGVRTKKFLAVHTIDCHRIRGKKFSNLQWQRNIRTVRCVISIHASDRPLLVQNITECIYRHDCGLAKIYAEALEYGKAQIELQIYVKNAINIVELIMDLENIRSVGKVRLEDASLPMDLKLRIQRGPIDRHLINDLRREGLGQSRTILLTPMINSAQRYGDIVLWYNDQKPTFSKDVFFGRQNEVNRLKSLLVGNVGGIALITGPKRIGKTSLCLRFLDDLSVPIQPCLVRVDLRGHHKSTSADVFKDISDALISKLHLTISSRRDIDGLIAVIENAVAILGKKQLVLVFDELGGPLQSFADDILGQDFFEFINSVLDRDLPLSILLVTPPAGLSIMNRYDVWSILRPMTTIPLEALDPEDAKEMITRPFSHYGVSFKPNALKKILFLTGNYPYQIILLLKEILNILNSQQNKVFVTEIDVELATKKLLRMDSLFSYLLRDASRIASAMNILHLLSTLKSSSDSDIEFTTEKSTSYSLEEELFSLLKQNGDFSIAEAHLALDRLVEDKIIDKHVQAKGVSYKFSIPLFHHWLQKRDVWESL